MNTAQYEADRRYKERNRALINQQSRERYYGQKAMPFAPRVDVANERRIAFLAAMDEIGDTSLRHEVENMIDAVAALLMERGGLKEYAARNQATEFVAAMVWNKATAPRRK